MTANQKIKTIDDTISVLDTEEENITNEYVAKYKDLKDLKIFADYYAFLVEKASATEKFRRTQKTFILEGFLPSEDCEKVQEEINSVTDAVIVEFSEPTKDDNPPTLTKNNKLVRQTEFITDMYSVPNYREIDPNKVVFFFFMLFMRSISHKVHPY
jgi:V/A-type H+-transporting ATPase subunit I